MLEWYSLRWFSICGCSSMVELQLPKLITRVRFPSPAPQSEQALIAQSVERIHGKDEVIGPIPIKGSMKRAVKHADIAGLTAFYFSFEKLIFPNFHGFLLTFIIFGETWYDQTGYFIMGIGDAN